MPDSVAIQVRVKGQLFKRLENWRRSQSSIPPRSQAIRALIEEALREVSKSKPETYSALGDEEG
jgi:hypothetical protein